MLEVFLVERYCYFTLLIFMQFGLYAEGKLSCDAIFSGLSPSQVSALSRAQGVSYRIEVLQKVFAGRVQNVVYLGESHIKTGRESQAGLDVLNQFRDRGLEGVNVENYWFPRLYADALSFSKTATATHGSTINAASVTPAIKKDIEMGLVAGLIKKVEAGESTREEVITWTSKKIEQQREGGSKDGDLLVNQVDQALNWGYIKEQLIALLDGKEHRSDNVEELAEVRQFYLESDHQPTLRENLYAAMAGVEPLLSKRSKEITGVGVGVLLLSALGPIGIEYWPQLAISPGALYSASSYGWTLGNALLISGLFSPMLGLPIVSREASQSRDRTMVRNIQRAFSEQPDMDLLLVIVGRNHVDNQVRLLEENGFERTVWQNDPQ
jgi:hypothetical protein